MKKIHLFLTGFILTLVMSSSNKANAQISQCAASDTCCIQYNEAIEAAEDDWLANLNKLKDQEKPASDMVDEAYENLRTYNCWLEYICRGVQYSGYAPIQSGEGTGLRSEHIGVAPGCQAPENLKMEGNFNTFVEKLNQVAILGGTPNEPSYYQSEKINFFPSCMTDPHHNNASPRITQVNDNFEGCKTAIELKFGCNDPEILADDQKLQTCMGESKAMMVVETTLKERHAEQRASAMENKLADLVGKLHTMEVNVTYLANFLLQLDQRLACIISVCT